MAVHFVINPMDRRAVCGEPAGHMATLSDESVTCGACLVVVEGRRKKAESQRKAERIALAFGLRLWE